MYEYVVRTGEKFTLKVLKGEEKTEKEASYQSRVVEIMDSKTFKAAMPMVNGNYILLDSLRRYKIEFIDKKGIFECDARILRRFKEKLNFFVVFEIISELEKVQRREYYRLECLFNIKYRRAIEGDLYDKDEDKVVEYKNLEGETEMVFRKRKVPWHSAIVTNISGGGLRFNSNHILNVGENVLLRMHLKFHDGESDFEVPARVVYAAEIEEHPGIYETRVQFVNIKPQVREEIIRFVFDEERRLRRKKE